MMRRSRINSPATRRRAPRDSRGFTIIELLTAVAIVIVLLSIVVVAVNRAIRTAQRTNTQSLMTAIKQGLGQFKDDTGYYPPVLNEDRDLRWTFNALGDGGGGGSGGPVRFSGPDPAQSDLGSYRDQIQQWHSLTSLADYLLGYGPVQQASGTDNFWSPDGYPGPGIRNPGSDGYWGASIERPNLDDPGTFDARMEFLDPDGEFAGQSQRFREGAVLGPYVQLRDERLLGAIDPNNLWQDAEVGQVRVYLPGEAVPPGLSFEDMPKVILDYWGQPIRYFRLPYPTGQPGASYRRVEGHETFGDPAWSPPSLSHVIALRPFSVGEGEATDAPPMGTEQFLDAFGDATTSRALQSAEFALLSAGPNRFINAEARVDDDELNRGNLVEVGP